MRTDRELLELAAKAANFGDNEGRFTWTESEYPRWSGKTGALWNYKGWGETAELWNPLTDDGDALRLAVNLGIFMVRDDRPIGEDDPLFNHDKYSATRRAIVLAAAEIGASMS